MSYSRNTFEAFAKGRHYVSVRVQQGVPVVDADVNESEDLRRYELRNHLRWFVGDGVPQGNDGFRILPSGNPNDVIIRGGDGTSEGAGRCLVDGMEAIAESDTPFSAQEFANPANAGAAGVPQVTLPATPTLAPRTDLYYLDLWEREVGASQAGHEDIVDARIGIETARRIRREWAVRVADAAAGIPADDAPPGHRYLLLASAARQPGVDIVPAQAITDLRRRGLAVQSRSTLDQIVRDAFGQNYTLEDDGQPRLVAGLREIINAMLRTGRAAPLSRGTALDTNGPHSFSASVIDGDGNAWLFWLSGSGEIWQRRQVNGSVWLAPELRRSVNQGTALSAVATSDGVLWLFWGERTGATQFDIRGQVFRGGVWEPVFQVSPSAPNASNSMVAAAAGTGDEVMVVWGRPPLTFFSRRYLGNPETPQAVVEVSNLFKAAPAVVALRGGGFEVFGLAALTTPSNILRALWNGATSTWLAPVVVGPKSGGQPELSATLDRFGGTWLLYANGEPTLVGRYLRAGFLPDPALLAELTHEPRFPSASLDAEGNIAVYFRPGNLQELRRLDLISEI